MKKLIVFIFLIIYSSGFSQEVESLALTDCYKLVKENFPLAGKSALLAKVSDLKIKNIDAAKYPEVDLKVLGTLQSDNISLQLPIPHSEAIDLPLYKGQAYLDAKYTIYDGGVREARKRMEVAELQSDQQNVEVELEKLRDQVNQQFLGIHLLKAKYEILKNVKADLQERVATLNAGKKHGVVLPVAIQKLEVEILRLDAKLTETKGAEMTLRKVLGKLLDISITETTQLILPENMEISTTEKCNRPELNYFQLQKDRIAAAGQLLDAKRKFKVGAFLKAGVGYPNPVNFFDDGVAPYAIGGVQLSWSILDWGKTDREKEIITIQNEIIEQQKESFLRNISVQDEKYLADIEKMQRLIENDKKITELQEKIKTGVEAQLKNGIITATEYLTEVNKVTQAKLNRKIHELQLLQLKLDYLTNNGM